MQKDDVCSFDIITGLIHEPFDMVLKQPFILSSHLGAYTAHNLLWPVCIKLSATWLLSDHILGVAPGEYAFHILVYLNHELATVTEDDHPKFCCLLQHPKRVKVGNLLIFTCIDRLKNQFLSSQQRCRVIEVRLDSVKLFILCQELKLGFFLLTRFTVKHLVKPAFVQLYLVFWLTLDITKAHCGLVLILVVELFDKLKVVSLLAKVCKAHLGLIG